MLLRLEVAVKKSAAALLEALRLSLRTNAGYVKYEQTIRKARTRSVDREVSFRLAADRPRGSEVALYSGLATIPETWPLG